MIKYVPCPGGSGGGGIVDIEELLSWLSFVVLTPPTQQSRAIDRSFVKRKLSRPRSTLILNLFATLLLRRRCRRSKTNQPLVQLSNRSSSGTSKHTHIQPTSRCCGVLASG